MTRRRWVYVDGNAYEVGVDILPEPKVETHHVMPDIKPYKSQVTGEVVESRSRHRDILRQHNLVEIGNEVPTLMKKVGPIQSPPGLKETLIEVARDKLRYS